MWLIANGISDIPIEKVQASKVPMRNFMIKTAEQILTESHITDSDIDNEVLTREGISPVAGKKTSEMAVQQCNNCHAINPPTHNFCSICGKPVNDATELSIWRIKDEVGDSPKYRAIMYMIKEKIADI